MAVIQCDTVKKSSSTASVTLHSKRIKTARVKESAEYHNLMTISTPTAVFYLGYFFSLRWLLPKHPFKKEIYNHLPSSFHANSIMFISSCFKPPPLPPPYLLMTFPPSLKRGLMLFTIFLPSHLKKNFSLLLIKVMQLLLSTTCLLNPIPSCKKNKQATDLRHEQLPISTTPFHSHQNFWLCIFLATLDNNSLLNQPQPKQCLASCDLTNAVIDSDADFLVRLLGQSQTLAVPSVLSDKPWNECSRLEVVCLLSKIAVISGDIHICPWTLLFNKKWLSLLFFYPIYLFEALSLHCFSYQSYADDIPFILSSMLLCECQAASQHRWQLISWSKSLSDDNTMCHHTELWYNCGQLSYSAWVVTVMEFFFSIQHQDDPGFSRP